MEENKVYKTNEEYFEALEKWLKDYYDWCNKNKAHLLAISNASTQILYYQQRRQELAFRIFLTSRQADILSEVINQNRTNNPNGPRVPVLCTIPALWKRFLAEGIDFIILFFIKFFFTAILLNSFNLLPLKTYDLETLHKSLNSDLNQAIDMTIDLFTLEILHRIIVCAFETFCTAGHRDGRGGATPGKFLLGLRIVSSTVITQAQGYPIDYVYVYPANNIGYFTAFLRSLIKNIVFLFLFPMVFAIYLFSYNRTGYDLICNSLVVEVINEVPQHRND